MSEVQQYSVDCHGCEAMAEVRGSGPDVLLVGAAVPMAWTRPTAEALARLDFRVINFDYGASHPRPEPRTALRQTDDVLAVMDAVEIDAPAVVGLSRGGITTYGLASRHPDRVSRMILVFPVAPFADTLEVGNPQPEQEPGESEEQFMRRSLLDVFSQGFLDRNLAAAFSLVTTTSGSVARVDRHEEEVVDADETVGCPTLVVEAGADRIVTSEHPRRYLQAIPSAEHVVVPEASHGWPMEEPGVLADLITGFLRPNG